MIIHLGGRQPDSAATAPSRNGLGDSTTGNQSVIQGISDSDFEVDFTVVGSDVEQHTKLSMVEEHESELKPGIWDSVSTDISKSQRTQEHLLKRQRTYEKRKNELVRRSLQLDQQEQAIEKEKEGVYRRLEESKRNALQRQEKVKRKEELARKRAEIENLERTIHQREKRLKQQKLLIKEAEERIKVWNIA